MLPIESCKKVLNKGNRKYSEEEVRMVREFLYLIAEIENNDLKTKEDECNNLL